MPCPVCPATSFVGGWVGGFFGIHPPKHFGGRVLSALVSAGLSTVTLLAIKSFFNLSLCKQSGVISAKNIAILASSALVLGVIYSIGVNYLLNRFVFTSTQNKPNPPSECPSKDKSCCKKG